MPSGGRDARSTGSRHNSERCAATNKLFSRIMALIALWIAAAAAAGDWGRVAGVVPPDADMLIVLEDASRMRSGEAGDSLTAILEAVLPLTMTTGAWRVLADKIDLPPEQAFDTLLGNRVVFVARWGDRYEQDGRPANGKPALQWAFISEVDSHAALRLLNRLGARPKDIRHNHPVAFLEEGRYQIASSKQGRRASLLFGPVRHGALFDELLELMGRDVVRADAPGRHIPTTLGATPDFLAATKAADAGAGAFFFIRHRSSGRAEPDVMQAPMTGKTPVPPCLDAARRTVPPEEHRGDPDHSRDGRRLTPEGRDARPALASGSAWMSATARLTGPRIDVRLLGSLAEARLPVTPFAWTPWDLLAEGGLITLVEPITDSGFLTGAVLARLGVSELKNSPLPLDGRIVLRLSGTAPEELALVVGVETSNVNLMAEIGDAFVASVAERFTNPAGKDALGSENRAAADESSLTGKTPVPPTKFTTLAGLFPEAQRTVSLNPQPRSSTPAPPTNKPAPVSTRSLFGGSDLRLVWSFPTIAGRKDQRGWWILSSNEAVHRVVVDALIDPVPTPAAEPVPVSFLSLRPSDLVALLLRTGFLTEAQTLAMGLSPIELVEAKTELTNGLLRGVGSIRLRPGDEK